MYVWTLPCLAWVGRAYRCMYGHCRVWPGLVELTGVCMEDWTIPLFNANLFFVFFLSFSSSSSSFKVISQACYELVGGSFLLLRLRL